MPSATVPLSKRLYQIVLFILIAGEDITRWMYQSLSTSELTTVNCLQIRKIILMELRTFGIKQRGI